MGWLMQRTGTSGKTTYTAMYRDIRGQKRSAGTFSSRREAERPGNAPRPNRNWAGSANSSRDGRASDLRQFVEVGSLTCTEAGDDLCESMSKSRDAHCAVAR